KNRLTITVSVKYTNTKDEKQSFESSFSRFTDYSSSVNLAAAEDELVREVFDQLVDDIFNKAVINW
ncbi:MAG TPA: LPS assembly lipoprotein LptE, partial [Bacteroidia bacterium]|nr:LPS assembly lipoprotein LptE [Bacteroidia bacterium]